MEIKSNTITVAEERTAQSAVGIPERSQMT